MVKVYGPMMSLDASGTLGDAITFSKWKGRNYVRERVIPSNPKSGAQVGRRAMFTFLTQHWAALSASEQATWQDLAEELVASRFNAYLSLNMRRWHNFYSPTQETPAGESNLASDRALTTAAWEENRIRLTSTATTANQQWGLLLFASLTDTFDPAVGNAIIAELDADILSHTTFWTPPDVQTWYFNSIAFSDDGIKATAGGEVSAVPP